MKRYGIEAATLVAIVIIVAVGLAGAPARAAESAMAYLEPWAAVLEQHTRAVESSVGTQVDYRALGRAPAATQWKQLLADLAASPLPPDRSGRMAFWIDAYNVLAIDTVLRAWPVDSIRDAGSFFSPVWKRDAGRAAGRPVTLHEIEHEILRPMGDPRIHAAIVCASTSCPSLRRTPFGGGDLDAKLDATMHAWLASTTKGLKIDRAGQRITVSKIFSWFEEDFEALGGVRAVLTRYAPEADRAWLEENAADAQLDYFDYDWNVNATGP